MVETIKTKQVCRAASTLLFPELEFDVKPCGKYTREDFLEILSRIAFDQEFANTGGKTLQLDRDEHVDITSTARDLLAKSLLYHLRNLSTDAIELVVDGVREPVAGSVLVFERRELGRELICFENVSEWDGLQSAPVDRGVGVGATYYMPVLNK